MKKTNDDVAAAVIEQLKAQNGGAVSPQILLDASRSPDSPLHDRFEWNDSKAGEKYRLIQAYRILAAQRTFKRVVEQGAHFDDADAERDIAPRAYLSTFDGSNIMRSREDIRRDPDLRGRNVRAFLAELHAWCRRTADFEELGRVRAAVLEALREEEKEAAE